MLDATFQTYPYKHLADRQMEDLNAATVADVQEFFDTYYVPNNATLVIVGDFDPEAALESARKHFSRVPRSKAGAARDRDGAGTDCGSASVTKS